MPFTEGRLNKNASQSALDERMIGFPAYWIMSLQTNLKLQEYINGLNYPQSESDAPFEVVQKDDLPKGLEVLSFKSFFGKLTKCEDWHGEEETKTRKKFEDLKFCLTSMLSKLTVLKIRRSQTQSDIYILGVDASGDICGVKTKTIET